jgi:hypothetical protein
VQQKHKACRLKYHFEVDPGAVISPDAVHPEQTRPSLGRISMLLALCTLRTASPVVTMGRLNFKLLANRLPYLLLPEAYLSFPCTSPSPKASRNHQ